MFIDYIPLMLANMAGGLAVLAFYLFFGSDKPDGKSWSPAFAVAGIVALWHNASISLPGTILMLSDHQRGQVPTLRLSMRKDDLSTTNLPQAAVLFPQTSDYCLLLPAHPSNNGQGK